MVRNKALRYSCADMVVWYNDTPCLHSYITTLWAWVMRWRNRGLGGGSDPIRPCKGAIFSGKDVPGNARRHYGELCKMAEQIKMLFDFWTHEGRKKRQRCGLMSHYFDYLLLLLLYVRSVRTRIFRGTCIVLAETDSMTHLKKTKVLQWCEVVMY